MENNISLDVIENIRNEIINNIKSMGINSLFPIQAEVIPHILRGTIHGRDICVSAPTGSGKTLIYAIPIINSICQKDIRRLRALVLVPTRDLVSQVYQVFTSLSNGLNINIVPLYGDKSFQKEQSLLVDELDYFISKTSLLINEAKEQVYNVSSLADIVISTPGRLVDHIQETPGFTLQHLEYLVIDEADRLLMQSYQDWLHKVLNATHIKKEGSILDLNGQKIFDYVTNRPSYSTMNTTHIHQNSVLQKLLFSATLTKNPQKISSLKLNNPMFFTSTEQSYSYKIPETVQQFVIVCNEDKKPLCIFHLLSEMEEKQILCFTGSVESTHRLCLFLKHMNTEIKREGHKDPLEIIEYSSNLTQHERNKIINDFKQGKPGLIVCSDIMSRGLDIHDIGAVINYDVPSHIKTYIHRIGRTGRAGRQGKSYTLAKPEEMRHFKLALKKAENSNQKQLKIPFETLQQYEERYKESLKQLQIELEREKNTILSGTSNPQLYIRMDSENENDITNIKELIKNQMKRNWLNERNWTD